jgi:hypothetical protein
MRTIISFNPLNNFSINREFKMLLISNKFYLRKIKNFWQKICSDQLKKSYKILNKLKKKKIMNENFYFIFSILKIFI